jgi:CDP-glucose 4,6-dehydratase
MIEGLAPGFDGKRVLLTGHTGFKGAWLVQWLTALGADVTGIALPEAVSEPCLFALSGLAGTCSDLRLDVRDAGTVARAVAEARPDLIIHMAAQALVGRGHADPLATFSTNVHGTNNILAAARGRGVGGVVIVTSDKVYRNDETGRVFREGDALGGRDPYSASKAAAEMVVEGYRGLTGMPPLVCARAGNVIGGGDWSEDRLVPDLARAAGAGKPVVLRHSEAVRPWQHVLDCLAGYLECGRRLLAGEETPSAVNFGPDATSFATVMGLSQKFLAEWGGGAGAVEEPDAGPWEAKTLVLDNALAKGALGWRPILEIDDAIAWSAGWYRRQLGGELAHHICTEQIAAYETMARAAA